jgi:hypothetical protein
VSHPVSGADPEERFGDHLRRLPGQPGM